MGIKLFLLFIILLATVPNLGFFTFPAFIILSLTAIILLILITIRFKDNKYLNIKNIPSFYYFIILVYSAFYYGGLYQNQIAITIGQTVFFFFIFLIFIIKEVFKSKINLLKLIIIFYILLAVFTIITSPSPIVDVFVVLKEAPINLLQGINPYNTSHYTQIYSNKIIDYVGYLPFSFIYTMPFVLIFKDPRYATIFSNLISALLIYKLFKKNNNTQIGYIIFTFLFLPRSFYILEHMYLDPSVFMFFLLFVYFFRNKKYRSAFFSLAFFFSFKQIHILLLPLFANRNVINKFFIKRNWIFFVLPFFLPVIFLIINPKAIIDEVFSNQLPVGANDWIVRMSLSLSTFINQNFVNNLRNMVKIYMIESIVFLILYILNYFKNNHLLMKIIFTLFIFEYLTYLAFFNHYFFIILFLYLYIISKDKNLLEQTI